MKMFILLLVLVANVAHGQSDIRSRLQGFEWSWVPAEWQASDIKGVVALVQNGEEPLFLRKRGLVVLKHLGVDSNEVNWPALLRNADNLSLKRRMVDELCGQLASLNTDLLALFVDGLVSSDEHLRFRAALCLQNYQHVKSVAAAMDNYYLTAPEWQRQELSKQ